MKRVLLNIWRATLMPVSIVLSITMYFWIALVNLDLQEANKFWRDWVF